MKRKIDLFEIGFVLLLLPAVVATMDRPPFFLGGKVLLWMGTWFLVRRLSDADRARVLSGLKIWLRPLPIATALLLLALAGAVLAGFSGLDQFQAMEPQFKRYLAGGLHLPVFALVVSLPVAILAWGYLPVRFASSPLPKWLVAVLPVIGFAFLHISTLGWLAPVTALVTSGLWWAWKGRMPLVPALVVHAVVGWMGAVGGLW